MVEILVFTTFLGISEVKYFIYNDFIVRQNTFYYDSLINSSTIAYQMLDLKTDSVYDVLFEKKYKTIRKYIAYGGTWTSTSKEVIKSEVSKERYANYNCLKVTEYTRTQTPLGITESKRIKYYADLEKILSKFNYIVYDFLGFHDQSNDPFRCLIRTDHIDSDGKLTNIMNVKIEIQNLDRSIIEEILSLPTYNE